MVDLLDVLDVRVKELLETLRQLKRQNSIMAMQLEAAESKLERQAGELGRWEGERQVVRDRIECVLSELEAVGDLPQSLAEVDSEK